MRYEIKTPIKVLDADGNGVILREGEVELDDKAAADFLQVGAVVAIAAPAAAPATKAAPEDEAERLAAIKDAIGKLNIDNGDLWTAAGKPQTVAIAEIIGWPVSAADRDAAWEALQQK